MKAKSQPCNSSAPSRSAASSSVGRDCANNRDTSAACVRTAAERHRTWAASHCRASVRSGSAIAPWAAARADRATARSRSARCMAGRVPAGGGPSSSQALARAKKALQARLLGQSALGPADAFGRGGQRQGLQQCSGSASPGCQLGQVEGRYLAGESRSGLLRPAMPPTLPKRKEGLVQQGLRLSFMGLRLGGGTLAQGGNGGGRAFTLRCGPLVQRTLQDAGQARCRVQQVAEPAQALQLPQPRQQAGFGGSGLRLAPQRAQGVQQEPEGAPQGCLSPGRSTDGLAWGRPQGIGCGLCFRKGIGQDIAPGCAQASGHRLQGLGIRGEPAGPLLLPELPVRRGQLWKFGHRHCPRLQMFEAQCRGPGHARQFTAEHDIQFVPGRSPRPGGGIRVHVVARLPKALNQMRLDVCLEAGIQRGVKAGSPRCPQHLMPGQELAFRSLARCLGSVDSRIVRVGPGMQLAENRLGRAVLFPGGAPGDGCVQQPAMQLLELGRDTIASQRTDHVGRTRQALQCRSLRGRRVRQAHHGGYIPFGTGLLDRPGDECGTLRGHPRRGAIVCDDLEVGLVAPVFMVCGMRRRWILQHGRGDARRLRHVEGQHRTGREDAGMAAPRAGCRGPGRQRTPQGIHGRPGQGAIVLRRRGAPRQAHAALRASPADGKGPNYLRYAESWNVIFCMDREIESSWPEPLQPGRKSWRTCEA